mmetsp:Transcript_5153/g.7259  ORF Transcript_5153/g.7259 Transcript_5153/m.7259 type:complete len:88 (+) Transcript_5153:75-338(+)
MIDSSSQRLPGRSRILKKLGLNMTATPLRSFDQKISKSLPPKVPECNALLSLQHRQRSQRRENAGEVSGKMQEQLDTGTTLHHRLVM